MKRLFAFVFIVALVMALLSCAAPAMHMPRACVHYAVPGMYLSNIASEGQLEILETDAQGRILIKYTNRSYIRNDESETVYVICQKYDRDYVYFYEDICYQFKTQLESGFEILKQSNDWNQSLDETKMSRRLIRTPINGRELFPQNELYYNDVRAAVCKEMCINEEDIVSFFFDDEDLASGKVLYVLSLDENQMQEQSYYFVMCDADYNISVYSIENIDMYYYGLREFKQANGWKYGF